MSSFNQPRSCNKECGSIIYFDRNSLVGHPKENIWLSLEYKEGRKTDTLHNCPRKNHNGTLTNGNANPTPVKTETNTAAAKWVRSITDSKLDNLAVVKAIAAALNEYIEIKEAGQ
jgi:hypothetical protein